MAQKRGFHDFLEKSALPIVVVILIPLAFVVYAYVTSTGGPSAPSVPSGTAQPVAASQNVTQATISMNDRSSLPQKITAAELVPFSFIIKNTGNTDGTVPYKVYVKWSTGEQDVIDENIATLSAGASTVIQENLKFEVATETASVYLELTETGETVQFALPRTN
jgi:hypothetical protein